jgi:Spy/CpxP family protein refolding chaperone
MTKFVVSIGFLVSLAAGLVIGLELRRPASASTPPATAPTTRPRSMLATELALTREQQQQMDQIWQEAGRRGPREMDEKRRQVRKERDEAIAALVRAEDKAKYDQILAMHAEKNAELEREMRESFQKAVEKTKQILSPEQAAKYEEFLKRHDRDREHGRRTENRAASRPGTEK